MGTRATTRKSSPSASTIRLPASTSNSRKRRSSKARLAEPRERSWFSDGSTLRVYQQEHEHLVFEIEQNDPRRAGSFAGCGASRKKETLRYDCEETCLKRKKKSHKKEE